MSDENSDWSYVGMLIAGIIITSLIFFTYLSRNYHVPEERYKLISAMGVDFKDVWNLPNGREYHFELEEGSYKKRFKLVSNEA